MSIKNCVGMKKLSFELELEIRFSETDAMGVVWHGNYLKYFEDAREKFGQHYQMEYLDMYRKDFLTPIVKTELDHIASVYYGDRIKVKIEQIYQKAAKLVFQYEVYNLSTNVLATRGKTTQVFISASERKLQLIKPEFYSAWENSQPWIEN